LCNIPATSELKCYCLEKRSVVSYIFFYCSNTMALSQIMSGKTNSMLKFEDVM